ncbi:Uncharacterised protein [Mycobacterium tuberculosis]|uniref:Uncharacterized protein n=1 Tax=Mycobacterium tuberculosis TaxID=1773 RepID=A0A655JSG9_MYCTX|nr:Uncharacterised protein [Mycobacterium tuberculosis]CNM85685.1 Uncharacterised protein [Mycobacterium tuberculosis]COX66655.1 Uncharacterised protein [Mycobacterium tuberculosis]
MSETAPCEPPNTSSTRASSGKPKCARASARSTARSSAAIDARTGTPTTSARRSPESGTAESTRSAVWAPTRLASPALALASWITTGIRRRRRGGKGRPRAAR